MFGAPKPPGAARGQSRGRLWPPGAARGQTKCFGGEGWGPRMLQYATVYPDPRVDGGHVDVGSPNLLLREALLRSSPIPGPGPGPRARGSGPGPIGALGHLGPAPGPGPRTSDPKARAPSPEMPRDAPSPQPLVRAGAPGSNPSSDSCTSHNTELTSKKVSIFVRDRFLKKFRVATVRSPQG